MTETEYREKQTQDTNQLKKAFDAGYSKGRKEGIDAMRDRAKYYPELSYPDGRLVTHQTMSWAAHNNILDEEAERLKEQEK